MFPRLFDEFEYQRNVLLSMSSWFPTSSGEPIPHFHHHPLSDLMIVKKEFL